MDLDVQAPSAELHQTKCERQADEEAPVEEFSGSDSDGDATASGLLHRSGLRLRR